MEERTHLYNKERIDLFIYRDSLLSAWYRNLFEVKGNKRATERCLWFAGGGGVSWCTERGLQCKIAHDILFLGDVLHQSSLCSQQSLFHLLKDLIGWVSDTRPPNTFLLIGWFESCHFQDSWSAQGADRRWTSTHYRIPEGPLCTIWSNLAVKTQIATIEYLYSTLLSLRWLSGW